MTHYERWFSPGFLVPIQTTCAMQSHLRGG
jgi:hypothetical protein